MRRSEIERLGGKFSKEWSSSDDLELKAANAFVGELMMNYKIRTSWVESVSS